MDNRQQQDVALHRWAVIGEAASDRLTAAERGALVRQIAARTHTHPDGSSRHYSRGTIDRWIRAWRSGGLEALKPAPRADTGTVRAYPELFAEAAALRLELPGRSAAQIASILYHRHGIRVAERTIRGRCLSVLAGLGFRSGRGSAALARWWRVGFDGAAGARSEHAPRLVAGVLGAVASSDETSDTVRRQVGVYASCDRCFSYGWKWPGPDASPPGHCVSPRQEGDRWLYHRVRIRLRTIGDHAVRDGGANERFNDMSRFRPLATQTPALIISALALTLSLGGGAYATTHAATERAPATTQLVSWQNLSLRNGWQSSNSIYGSGNPRVSLQNGIVYLSGSLHQFTPGSYTFTVLPKKYRPAHNMWITVYTFGDTSGTLYIGHDGITDAYSPGTCNSGNTAQCYTSLATVSYPVNS